MNHLLVKAPEYKKKLLNVLKLMPYPPKHESVYELVNVVRTRFKNLSPNWEHDTSEQKALIDKLLTHFSK